MSKMVYWCPECEIPVIDNSICPLCGTHGKQISQSGICNPVFLQEKRLLSDILSYSVEEKNMWYLGSSYYLIDGKRTRIPYVDYYKAKKHLEVAQTLRSDIENNDEIPNQLLFIKANERYINELIYEAENYIISLVEELKSKPGQAYMPTVSFSGGKDSTVVSRVVRDALQNESIIHYFGNTTLEFPSTHIYVDSYFRRENPFTPMIPSETDNDFFKLCKVF